MYKPIPELPSPAQRTEMPDEQLFWDLPLNEHHFNLRDVHVNLQSTSIALRLATLGSMIVSTTESTPPPSETKERPWISGISGLSIGGLVAASGGFAPQPRTPPYAEANLIVPEEQRNFLPNRQKPVLSGGFNMANIATIVAEQRKKDRSMPQTKALAFALDGAMRAAIIRGAREKLMTQEPELDLGIPASIIVAVEASAVASAVAEPHLAANTLALTAALYAGCVFIDLFANKMATGSLELKRRQWSLSPFHCMPDRLLLTRAVSHELTFVKYRPGKA